MNYLPRSFFQQDTVLVARELLGKLLVRCINDIYCIGRIVETEAYMANDPASHAFKGENSRNRSLFGPVGHAYVYRSYGIHYCLNIVARHHSVIAGGALIRAVEPIDGIDLLRMHRRVTDKELSNGPGKLTQAFALDMSYNGYDVVAGCALNIAEDDVSYGHVWQAGPRIGISKAIELPWRFYIKNNPWVSKSRLNESSC